MAKVVSAHEVGPLEQSWRLWGLGSLDQKLAFQALLIGGSGSLENFFAAQLEHSQGQHWRPSPTIRRHFMWY